MASSGETSPKRPLAAEAGLPYPATGTLGRTRVSSGLAVALRPALTCGALLIAALAFYGGDLSPSPSPLRPDEVMLARQVYSIAQTGRDLDGRFLPLYVHGDADVWFPPVPAYAAVVVTQLFPASAAAVRWPSVLSGVIAILLVFLIGHRLFASAMLSVLAAALVLLTPAFFMFSRLAVDGIFAVPFVLASILCVLSFLEQRRPWQVWAAGLLLGIGFYANTTAPIMMPIYLGVAALTLWAGGHKRPAIHGWLAFGFVLPLLCLVPWFAAHPESYPDTLGRWAIHAAHVRNPVDGLRAVVNWNSLTNRASVYWEFLNPAFLFFPADENSSTATTTSGPLLFPLLILSGIGIARVWQSGSPAVRTLLLTGPVVAPLAAATFGENHAIGRVLVLIPFVAILATLWIESVWALKRPFGRIAAGLVLMLLALQFAVFHHDYLSAYRADAARGFQDAR